MAKKFRCVKCGNIVDINPSYEVLCCPHCGSRYRNTFYDPYAAQNGGVNQYGAPYIFGSQYGAYPQTTPMGVPVEKPVADQPVEEVAVASESYNEYPASSSEDAEVAVRRLKGKKLAHAVLLILSILALAVSAFVVYYRFAPVNKTVHTMDLFNILFKGKKIGAIVKDGAAWYSLLPVMFALASFAAMVLAAMHINVANIRLKEYNEGVDLSASLKSAKLAGYAVVMLLTLVLTAYFALYGCGGFVKTMMDAAKGTKMTFGNFMMKLGNPDTLYAAKIVAAFASFGMFVYSCYKIADTNKKYSF